MLTDGTVGAGVARASTVTLVMVEAEADTDTLVLARKVTTGIDCGGETGIRDTLK